MIPDILKYFTELPRGSLGAIIVPDKFEQKLTLDAISVQGAFDTSLIRTNMVHFVRSKQTLQVVCPEDYVVDRDTPPIIYDVAWVSAGVDIHGFMAREEFYIEDY